MAGNEREQTESCGVEALARAEESNALGEQELLSEEESKEFNNPRRYSQISRWIEDWDIDGLLIAQVAKLKAMGYEQVWEDCPDCNATGFLIENSGDHEYQRPCPSCENKGRVRKLVEWDREKVAKILHSWLHSSGSTDWGSSKTAEVVRFGYRKRANQLKEILGE